MYDINSNINNILEKVEKTLVAKFKCSTSEIKSPSRIGELSIIRNVLYLFLHDYVGVSTKKIASLYNRTQRHIVKQNAKTRCLVKLDYDYRNVFLIMKHDYEKGE